MKAAIVERWMEPSELVLQEVPEPVLTPGSVLIEVEAAGCNFFDILLCQGRYQVKPPFPFVPGSELAGVVREVADDVQGTAPGDRVYGSVPLGAFAEVARAPAGSLRPVPEGMSPEEACGLPIVATSEAAHGVVSSAGAGIETKPNFAALASAIGYILDSPDEAARMGENGRDFAEGHNWSAVGGRMLEFYRRVSHLAGAR